MSKLHDATEESKESEFMVERMGLEERSSCIKCLGKASSEGNTVSDLRFEGREEAGQAEICREDTPGLEKSWGKGPEVEQKGGQGSGRGG